MLATVLMCTLAGAAQPVVGAATGVDAYPRRSGALQRWAPAHMAEDYTAMTRELAIATARAFDLVAGTERKFGPYIADMKAANPNLVMLLYVNGVYANPLFEKFPDAWYARNADGGLVVSKAHNNLMMDMSNQNWLNNRAGYCRDTRAKYGFDHCYIDNFGVGPVMNRNKTKPIDPRTGKNWTKPAKLAADLEEARAIKALNPGTSVSCNGLADGSRYFKRPGETPVVLFEEVDACHAEIFLRDRNTGVFGFKTEIEWKRDVDMLVDVGRRGKVAFTTTKMWKVSPTAAQADQWHKYSLATFLLGTDGRSYFHFSVTQKGPDIVKDHPWGRVDVGDPVGAYAKAGGAYRRNFTKGVALVNPTLTTVTVALGGSYRDLNGVVRTSVTLPPNTGEVLTKI